MNLGILDYVKTSKVLTEIMGKVNFSKNFNISIVMQKLKQVHPNN